MNNNTNFKTFFLISNEKLIIIVNDILKKQIVYKKEFLIDVSTYNFDLSLIEKFLNNHIFEIEKTLNNFINNIYLIVDHKDFFSIEISLKENNYGNSIDFKKIGHLLAEAREQCKKTINDRKIIHMIIDNYLIDNKKFNHLPEDTKCDFFSLDLRIICFSNELIRNLEEIFKKYQISVDQILYYKYFQNFKKLNNKNDIFNIAEEVLAGSNQNEAFITSKITKKLGFFEKFFFFFS